jgi:tetratricopeptide (TPR) repeat protein
MIVAFLLLLFQDPAALSQEGVAAMRAQRYGDAVRVYRTLVKQDAANPMWRLNLGMALFYASDYAEAAGELAQFVKVRPQPGPAHLFLGVSRLKLQQPCEAIAPLEEAMRWPQKPQARWVELADAYQGCKRWEPAARAYGEAAKADPKDSRIVRQQAHCLRMARRYDLAKPLFAALEGPYADNAEFQFEYGDTLMRLDGAEAGLQWLEKSVSADPALIPGRSALGRALLELGRASDAIPHLEMASKEDAAALLPLSRAYRSVGRASDAAQAEAQYKQRISAQP